MSTIFLPRSIIIREAREGLSSFFFQLDLGLRSMPELLLEQKMPALSRAGCCLFSHLYYNHGKTGPL